MSTQATPGWVRDAIFYQVFPDRFASSQRVHKPGPMEDWLAPPTAHGFKGGDLLGIVEHLDYLQDLGITALYLNPIFASASNHRYHTYDYTTVDPLLGGDAALRELVDEAHARGMRVVLDGVFNHTGRGFWPFHHVMETGGASPYREWFHLNTEWLATGRQLRAYPSPELPGPLEAEWGDEHRGGDRSLHQLGYRAWWDLPALPKLNVGNLETREYLLGVAELWIRFGADGWRLDVASEIDDMEFWAEFRSRVRAVNPDAYLVAEIWEVQPDWLGPRAFDAFMNYPLAWSLIGFAGARHLDRRVMESHGIVRRVVKPLDGAGFLAQVGAGLAAYPPEHVAAQMNLLDSHDTPRVLSLCGGDEASVRLAMMLLMALPGAPTVYYGDEVGMLGESDPDCRRAFDWDSAAWNSALRDWVRRAIAARRAEPALRGDGFVPLAAHRDACAFRRDARGGRSAMVAVNAGETAAMLRLPADAGPASDPLFTSGDGRATFAATGGGALDLLIPPRWGGIWPVPG